jgi:hypothetical protein
MRLTLNKLLESDTTIAHSEPLLTEDAMTSSQELSTSKQVTTAAMLTTTESATTSTAIIQAITSSDDVSDISETGLSHLQPHHHS